MPDPSPPAHPPPGATAPLAEPAPATTRPDGGSPDGAERRDRNVDLQPAEARPSGTQTRPTERQPAEAPGPAEARPSGRRAGAPPRRVVVTSPRTEAARRARPMPRRLDELADQTEIGDVLIRSLIRAQLGLGLRVLAVLVVLLGGLPLLFAVVPGAGSIEVGGVAIPWLLLGVATFPLLVLLGVVYMRQAERNERDFTDLVER